MNYRLTVWDQDDVRHSFPFDPEWGDLGAVVEKAQQVAIGAGWTPKRALVEEVTDKGKLLCPDFGMTTEAEVLIRS